METTTTTITVFFSVSCALITVYICIKNLNKNHTDSLVFFFIYYYIITILIN